MASPMEVEVVERLSLLLDRIIKQTERLDGVISDLERRKDELRETSGGEDS